MVTHITLKLTEYPTAPLPGASHTIREFASKSDVRMLACSMRPAAGGQTDCELNRCIERLGDIPDDVVDMLDAYGYSYKRFRNPRGPQLIGVQLPMGG